MDVTYAGSRSQQLLQFWKIDYLKCSFEWGDFDKNGSNIIFLYEKIMNWFFDNEIYLRKIFFLVPKQENINNKYLIDL
jgi:hypothetical protein